MSARGRSKWYTAQTRHTIPPNAIPNVFRKDLKEKIFLCKIKTRRIIPQKDKFSVTYNPPKEGKSVLTTG